ncbi:hypothetical protein [Streptomyces sp. ISL-100]|uniref:hypothetical protein n=1 Tax=Streptomyces sp. ISL-100 TaxID=2819173 RepID=UPI001BE598CC|nr:hypothetical protein [Streptomyces sp. ISL-100]MBT2397743.1 hypothetical protein [Streptomyces sp. ISL-100]
MGTALIAVIGTLLGSVATHFFQRQTAERAAALTRAEQLRQERISTYSAFAGALVDYRRAQNDRWHRRAEAPDSADARNSRLDSYAQRSAARQALIRVQLVCAGRQVVQLALSAFDFVHCMHEATDASERARRSVEADNALARFIEAAAPSVR